MPAKFYIGIMSGTSLDGIDITIVKKEADDFNVIKFICISYPKKIRTQLASFNKTQNTNLQTLSFLEKELAKLYCQAVDKILHETNMQAEQITAIGCHGQTIFHDSACFSMQLGHPAFIAKATGITTVADFRIDDMANNGQGAPIAPAFHQFMLGNKQPIAIVNIGGIANLTILKDNQIIGFDTGPGNALMDELCQIHLAKNYDTNGDIAKRTTVNKELLTKLLTDKYFTKVAPKSTGRDVFNLDWLAQHLKGNESIDEQISTLNQLTASTIANAINPHKIKEILICGGGVENTTLLARIAEATQLPVVSTDKYNINPHSLEAFICAWLAVQRLEKKAIKLTNVTGASKDSILGGIWEK